jgi:hypothetical protein
VGNVGGDDRSSGGGLSRCDNRSLLLDDLWLGLGSISLGLVLLLLLLSLVLLSEQTTEDGGALAGCGARLGLLRRLLGLVVGAAGSRSGTGRSSNDRLLSGGGWDLSLSCLGRSVGALLRSGGGSSR